MFELTRAAWLDRAANHARVAVAVDDSSSAEAAAIEYAREQVAQGTVGAGAFLMGVGELVMLSQVLGLLEGGGRRATAIDPQLKAKVESLVYLRQEARRQRDFAEADRLREELTRLGVVLEDTRDGTTWKLQS